MAKVVFHQPVLDAALEAVIEAYYEAGEAAIEANKPHVPDAPPYGVGLVESGRVVVYLNGAIVRDSLPAQGEPNVKVTGRGVELFLLYPEPAGFLEFGTIKMSPHPFATGAIVGGLKAAAARGQRTVSHR